MNSFKEMFEKDMKKHKQAQKETLSQNYYFKVLTKLTPDFGVNFNSLRDIFKSEDYTEELVRDRLFELYEDSPLCDLYVTKQELTLQTIFCTDFYKSRVFQLFHKCISEYNVAYPFIVFKTKKLGDTVLCRDKGDTAIGRARIILPSQGVVDNLAIFTLSTFVEEYGDRDEN